MLHKNSSKSKKPTIFFKILKSLEKTILKKFLHKLNNQQKIIKKHKILNIDLVKDLKKKLGLNRICNFPIIYIKNIINKYMKRRKIIKSIEDNKENNGLIKIKNSSLFGKAME
jgi:hypothetical protein